VSRQSVLKLGHELERLLRGGSGLAQESRFESKIKSLDLAFWKSLSELTESEDPTGHLRDLASKRPAATTHHSVVCANIAIERALARSLTDDAFVEPASPMAAAPGQPQPSDRELSSRVLLLDNLRSAFNIGSVIRTAQSLGFNRLWTSGYTAELSHPAVMRASLGAEKGLSETLSFARVEDAISEAKRQGNVVVALETSASAVSIDEFAWSERCALVVGNERFGLEPATLALCDHVVAVKMKGCKSSLNVAVATALALKSWDRSLTSNDVRLRPVGWVRSPARRRAARPNQGVNQANRNEAEIELDRSWIDPQCLSDLNGFERIWLIADFHLNRLSDRSAHWRAMVRPPLGSERKRGVFATRSPHRPNGLALSCVRLLAVQTDRLFIDECDLLDGTPIYDIKPYIPQADSFPDAKTGWAAANSSVQRHSISYSWTAKRSLEWLSDNGVAELRLAIETQLTTHPTDEKRKRITLDPDSVGRGVLSVGTWRVRFTIDPETAQVQVNAIDSGYSAFELDGEDDPYQDKLIHRRLREFVLRS
jgi:tRNA-Thr(GGU) m(6)t(6)A37 methyltransferase TsaA